jgi:hypothetical protein
MIILLVMNHKSLLIMKLSAFRTQGVPRPTSKFVDACPCPDGLARDGTQGRSVAHIISHQGGVLVVRVTSVHERERESEHVH